MMVFDLDPGAPADIVQCCQVGLWLRDLLGRMKLKSFAKTSGSKGLQVLCAVEHPGDVDQTKDVSRAFAQYLEGEHPNLVTSNMSKALRKGKVFVDWSQNDEHKTTICVYSLRAKDEPTVSTPVKWEEVQNCLKKKKADLLRFRCEKNARPRKKVRGPLRAGRETETKTAEEIKNLAGDRDLPLFFEPNASRHAKESSEDPIYTWRRRSFRAGDARSTAKREMVQSSARVAERIRL